jgi:flagellar basal-body rod protein FlgC
MSSGLGGIFGIAASGMSATRTQMDVVAENLANADSTSGPDGKPYQRKIVQLSEGAAGSFASALDSASGSSGGGLGGVQVDGISADPTPGQKIYDPGNPAADAQGYVTMPNVNTVSEMVDMITATRSYEANVQVLNAAKQMYTRTLDILRQ